MKKTECKKLFSILLLILCCPTLAQASEFTLVNKISFLSEYYSRGITQTKELPAPQFETTLFHDSGLFAGAFISRVEFLDNDQADQELDAYIAYHKTLDRLYLRAGGLYFTYPNSDDSLDYNFFEADFAIGYNFGPFYSEASLRYSPNHFANSGREYYPKIEVRIPIEDNLRIKSHIAHRSVENNTAFFYIPNSFDWEFGLEYSPIKNVDLIAKYVDSDFKKSDCFNRSFCDERLITGLRYSF